MATECTIEGEVCGYVAQEGWNITGNGSALNGSALNGSAGNDTEYGSEGPVGSWTIVFTTFYGIICVMGIFGNGLVIYVVARYAKMKTVTNMYILNLAIADLCFLIGLPFLIVTAVVKQWLFGYIMCKVFFILTSINWFTSVFTLTVMSADRYLAVCHPISSMRYRTPLISRIVCIFVWVTSLLVMLPIVLYATTVEHEGHVSCSIVWPSGQAIPAEKAFIWYALLLGFAIPVALIIVFYALVLLRLQTVGPKTKSKEKKKSRRKVTKMVLTIITVYVICWLPYWVFQITLTFVVSELKQWCILVFQSFTLLSYANSLLNPLLYAFLSENFRKSFIKAFHCADMREVNGALNNEHSTFPTKTPRTSVTAVPRNRLHQLPMEDEEEIEFTTTKSTCTSEVTASEIATTRLDGTGGKTIVESNICKVIGKDVPPPAEV